MSEDKAPEVEGIGNPSEAEEEQARLAEAARQKALETIRQRRASTVEQEVDELKNDQASNVLQLLKFEEELVEVTKLLQVAFDTLRMERQAPTDAVYYSTLGALAVKLAALKELQCNVEAAKAADDAALWDEHIERLLSGVQSYGVAK